MLEAIKKLITNPKKYIPMAIKMAPQPLYYLFRRTPFFMQSQMDIHPRSRWYKPDFTEFAGGFQIMGETQTRKICNLEPWDNTRRDMLLLLLRTIITNNIAGDFAELGVYKGFSAKLIHYYVPERTLHLFDTFEGFTKDCINTEKNHTGHAVPGHYFSDTCLPEVQQYIAPMNTNIHFHPGVFPASIPSDFFDKKFAFAHLDADLYEPTKAALTFFYPRMTANGLLVIHDYNSWQGARKAVDEFFIDKLETPIPMPDKCGSALIIKG